MLCNFMITIKGHLTGRGNTKGKIIIKKERTMANWRFRDQIANDRLDNGKAVNSKCFRRAPQ